MAELGRYLNRELSWLDFNERVLACAESADLPLLARTDFLSIFASNLDEFFQVRVAGLLDQVAAAVTAPGPDGLTPAETLTEIRRSVTKLVDRASVLLADEILPALEPAGLSLLSWDQLDAEAHKHLDEVFFRRIFPVLTPLAVDPGHPFPYISDLSLNLAVTVRDPQSGQRRFARVKVPPNLDRLVPLATPGCYIPLEEVIAAHLPNLFPGTDVLDHVPFRVTRNADLTLEEEEADDLLAALEMELRRRRFGGAVRLEVADSVDEDTLKLLTAELDLDADAVYRVSGLLDLTGLGDLHSLGRGDLEPEPWPAVVPPELVWADEEDTTEIFRVIRSRDVLVHHPYESFAASVEAFIRQAAADPKVQAIKMTLYRTSGDSPIVKSLIRAAESGKQVAVLVELKARFDEARNISWARALEEVGVHVVYGLVGLKTHAKTALVVRQESSGLRRYAHLGTGNYNSATAQVYEDLGLFTADPDIGTDVSALFNYLTGFGRGVEYRRLLIAPERLRDELAGLIDGEAAAGSRGRITMKINSLADPAMVDRLYAASQRGVQIDLIVRGICCLRPGVPGLSESIRVVSVVGRFLEHSRIYSFANGSGPGERLVLMGSADVMGRNLDHRVEAVVPVDDPQLQDRLDQILDAHLDRRTRAWDLGPDGVWSDRAGPVRDSQSELRDAAIARSTA